MTIWRWTQERKKLIQEKHNVKANNEKQEIGIQWESELEILAYFRIQCHIELHANLQPNGTMFQIPVNQNRRNNPWNSPGQNTGVGSLSLLQGIFPTQGSNPVLPHCRQVLYKLSHKEAQEYWSGQPIPSPGDLPNPGIEPESPALQADSLPTELSGKPRKYNRKS